MCESRVEVETPYWAVNSEGSVRAVLNNQEFEQAVHKEICTYVTYHSTDMQVVFDSVLQYFFPSLGTFYDSVLSNIIMRRSY